MPSWRPPKAQTWRIVNVCIAVAMATSLKSVAPTRTVVIRARAPTIAMAVFFISDLHLTDSRPDINRVFFDFLRGPALDAEALYILGDLFEYWAGDDDLGDPFNKSVAGALAGYAHAGRPVSFSRPTKANISRAVSSNFCS